MQLYVDQNAVKFTLNPDPLCAYSKEKNTEFKRDLLLDMLQLHILRNFVYPTILWVRHLY